MSRSLGVGFLGAGPVTQAIHLPTLAGFPDRFHVVSVMDVDAALAERVASRCDAASTTEADAVIQDPNVDVVVVGSPNTAHAAQVIAACQAAKLAILCEKPMVVSHAEAEHVEAAASASGTTIVVGAMHVYDPAYRAAREAWLQYGEEAVLTQSAIFLPSNEVFTEQATEPASIAGPMSAADALSEATMLRFGIVGLAIHNLPLVRQFHPRLGEVASARFLPPFGFDIVVTDDDHTIELLAYMGGSWPPDWTFRVVGETHELRVSFPPSYVLAGSSRAELVGIDTTTVFEFDDNGYQREWTALHDAALGVTEPLVTLRDVVDDITFALDLADQVDQLLAEKP